MGIGLVDYAVVDNRRVTMPHTICDCQAHLYIHECMYNPEVTLTLHKCHSILTIMSPTDKRKPR